MKILAPSVITEQIAPYSDEFFWSSVLEHAGLALRQDVAVCQAGTECVIPAVP